MTETTTDRQYRIGRWHFDPAAKSLSDDTGDTVQLEDKVARLLDLFCMRAGDIITREDIVAAVWGGRAVSEQTVPVAISKLRKALNDSREPGQGRPLLETIPKRGYRLNLQPAPQAQAASRRPLWLLGALAALALVVGGLWGQGSLIDGPAALAGKPGIILTVKDIRAPSGDSDDIERAVALSELGAYFLSRVPDLLVIRHWWNFDAPDPTGGIYTRYGKDTPVYLLKGTLIDDGGQAVVLLTLSVPLTEEVLWTGRLDAAATTADYFALLGTMVSRVGVSDSGARAAADVPITASQSYWLGRYEAELSNAGAANRAFGRWRALLSDDPGNIMVANGLAALAARWPSVPDDVPQEIQPIAGDQLALVDAAAVSLYRDDAPRHAISLLEQALDLAPGDHYALSLLAEARVKTGDIAGALEAYGKAIRLAPYAKAYGERLAAIEAREIN